MSNAAATGYRGIVRSTVLVGGTAAIGLALGMVRGKLIAVKLGPAGVGILGNLNSLLPLLTTLLSFGLAQSAVKTVAADGTGPARGAASVYWLTPRLASLALVAITLGALLTGQSRIWGGAHSGDLYWLAIGVAAAILGSGWGAILQGRQALGRLTLASVVAALVSTALAWPCIVWWGTGSVAIVLVLGTVAGALGNWWALQQEDHPGRGLEPDPVAARAMLRLGLVLAGGSILTQGTAVLTRFLVTREAGLDGAGWYQAAITLAATMPGFALSAMGASLYPQLVAAPNRDAAHELVNRQLQIALLAAGPVLLWVSTFPGLSLRLLYAKGFQPAIELMGWIVLGTFARLLTWPVGYLLLARSAGRLFLLAEAMAAALLVIFTWAWMQRTSLVGSGIAFATAYGIFSVLLLGLAWKVHRFRLTARSLQWIFLMGLALLVTQFVLARQTSSFARTGSIVLALAVSLAAALGVWRLTRRTHPT